ncbi:hypothetical protein [Vibrio splendidus]|uniref:hypothetical protein n=1 Tax=Vibrio splendidus TaxID=29497 RepID=UPI0011B255C5|nr:hypothetical protein [Vibrio splendidus]
MMEIGKTWAILEWDETDDSKKLLSLMPPKSPVKYVHMFVEQTYVDRYGDLDDRLAHKKRTSLNLRAQSSGSAITLKLNGESRFIIAYKCLHSRIQDGTFYFTFNKIVLLADGLHRTEESDTFTAKFEEPTF